jgi:hypothetical protein
MGNTAALVSGVAPDGATNLFVSTDVEADGRIQVNATTAFVNDANAIESSKNLPIQLDRLVHETSSDLVSMEIKEFLSRPIILQSGTLTVTDTFSTFLDMNMPGDFLINPLYSDKLRGYLGFRATCVIRLVINANRFQQGRYILGYVPTGGASDNGGPWVNDHMNTLVQRTTIPHVEFDLCCDSEAVFRIPYSSCLNFYPLVGGVGDNLGHFGNLRLYPYSALVAVTGNITAGYTIYGHFEDLVLLNAAVPQSGRAFSSSVRKKNATEVEQDSSDFGPVSSALIKVSNFASIVAKIPLLTAYASSVSWFADIGASAAKVFGWRKPVVLAPSTRITQNYLPYAANNDGPDMSFPLSLSYENQVGMANGFSGTEVDEMDFSFLCTIPTWFGTASWSTSQPSGTVLTTFSVTPYTSLITTANGQNFNNYSPVAFVANHFSNWRGSMVFKLKFVKTEFHSGRLVVAFSPRTQIADSTTVTLANSSYINRHVIDIRETNEFTFVVPFVSEASYLDFSSVVGSVTVIVLDPLVAPATVSSSISLLCEKAGGPDIEFAVPRPFVSTYYAGIIPQSGSVFTTTSEGTNVCSNNNSTIGGSAIRTDNSVNALNCVGEKITSVRSLLKLPVFSVNTTVVTPTNFVNIVPFAIQAGSVFTTVNTVPVQTGDLYSNFASCYAYSRGGVRIKFVDNVAVTATQPCLVSLYTITPVLARNAFIKYSTTSWNGTVFNSTRNNMPVVYYKSGYSGEVQVPQYLRYHSRANYDCVVDPNFNTYDDSATGLAPRVVITRQTFPLSVVDTSVLRSGADDLNFGFFISVPPMGITSSF